eukprot:2267540-Prymnesium_polylepis.1
MERADRHTRAALVQAGGVVRRPCLRCRLRAPRFGRAAVGCGGGRQQGDRREQRSKARLTQSARGRCC